MTTDSDLYTMRNELFILFRDRAFQFGDFTLSSGRKSPYYFDGKQVTLDGRGLFLVASLILDRCRGKAITAIGGLTLGADPIAAAVATISGNTDHPLKAFIVRDETKTHGTKKRIEGPQLVATDHIVLIDDVITTGGAFLKAADAVRETGATIVEAIALVDRQEGGRENIENAHIPFFALFQRDAFMQ